MADDCASRIAEEPGLRASVAAGLPPARRERSQARHEGEREPAVSVTGLRHCWMAWIIPVVAVVDAQLQHIVIQPGAN
jgi:hypothetical protein